MRGGGEEKKGDKREIHKDVEYSGTSEHFRTNSFVPCREVVPILEVK